MNVAEARFHVRSDINYKEASTFMCCSDKNQRERGNYNIWSQVICVKFPSLGRAKILPDSRDMENTISLINYYKISKLNFVFLLPSCVCLCAGDLEGHSYWRQEGSGIGDNLTSSLSNNSASLALVLSYP